MAFKDFSKRFFSSALDGEGVLPTETVVGDPQVPSWAVEEVPAEPPRDLAALEPTLASREAYGREDVAQEAQVSVTIDGEEYVLDGTAIPGRCVFLIALHKATGEAQQLTVTIVDEESCLEHFLGGNLRLSAQEDTESACIEGYIDTDDGTVFIDLRINHILTRAQLEEHQF